MLINIPFSGDAESTEPLRRCIRHAAAETGVSDFLAALVMSHFLDELVAAARRGPTGR